MSDNNIRYGVISAADGLMRWGPYRHLENAQREREHLISLLAQASEESRDFHMPVRVIMLIGTDSGLAVREVLHDEDVT